MTHRCDPHRTTGNPLAKLPPSLPRWPKAEWGGRESRQESPAGTWHNACFGWPRPGKNEETVNKITIGKDSREIIDCNIYKIKIHYLYH